MLILDGMHERHESFNARIVAYAVKRGMELRDDDFPVFQRAMADTVRLVGHLSPEDGEAIYEISEEAVTWLNDEHGMFVWWIEDSGLHKDLPDALAPEDQAELDAGTF